MHTTTYTSRLTSFRWLWVICLLLCVPAFVHAEGELPAFTAKYEVARDGIAIGTLSNKLSRIDNTTYLYESVKQPSSFVSLLKPDVITETSRWQYHNNSVRPLQYTYSRSGGKKDRQVEIIFDWQQMQAQQRVNNKPRSVKITDQVQDDLGYLLALMLDARQGKKNMLYKIADGGSLDEYRIILADEETVKTALGKMPAVIAQRTTEKKQTRIWLAREMNYLPVKIEHKDKHGVVYSMHILEYN